MSKKAELTKNTVILFVGKLSTHLISFLLLPLYTFYLSPSGYGYVDLIVTYVSLVAPILTIQLEMASFRFLVDARNNKPKQVKIISNVLKIVLSIIVICFVVALIFSRFIKVDYFGLILLNVSVSMLFNLFLQFARGFGNNKSFAIASIISGLSMAAGAAILIAYLKLGVAGMLLSMAAANLLGLIYLFLSLKTYQYFDLRNFDKELNKELILYSAPLIPNGISWWIISVSDRAIVSIFVSVAANGIYAIANKYAAIFSSVFAIFNMSWTESVSLHIDSKDRDSFLSDTINASLKLFGSLAILLISFIPIVFSVLVNRQFAESYFYIPILIVAAFFNMLVSLYSAVYIAKKMTKQVANTSILAAVINIILNLVLIKFIGIYAAAISTLVSYFVMTLFRHYDIKKYVNVTYQKNLFVKLFGASLIVISLYYLNNIYLNIVNVIFAAAFTLFLNKSVLTKLINKVLSVEYFKK